MRRLITVINIFIDMDVNKYCNNSLYADMAIIELYENRDNGTLEHFANLN